MPTPENGQITLMILEHEKPVPKDADNPGKDTRDRVLIGMKVIDSSGNSTEYGDLELPEIWSLIMVHEPVEGGTPYGVVEISNIEYTSDEDSNLLSILSFALFLEVC